MRHHLAVILVAFGVVGSCYCAWALHRISDEVLFNDVDWPRSWPYPDRGLAALHAWYDAAYPAPRDSLKLHGELPRVQLTVQGTLAFSLLVLVAGVGMGATRRFPKAKANP